MKSKAAVSKAADSRNAAVAENFFAMFMSYTSGKSIHFDALIFSKVCTDFLVRHELHRVVILNTGISG